MFVESRKKLDLELIIRKAPLRLTEAGKRLLTYAENALREEQEMLEELENLKSGIDVVLSLAINNNINRFFATDLLLDFCQKHPSAKLKVDVLPSRAIIYAVLGGKKELGFGPFQTQMDAYEMLPLFEAKRYLVVGQKNPHYSALLRKPQKIFKKMPLLTSFLDEAEMRPSFDKIRDHFATVWQINNEPLRLSLVDAGLGVTFMGDKLYEKSANSYNLTIVEKSSFSIIDRHVGLYYKKGEELSAGAQAFIKVCKTYWNERH